MFTLKNNFEDNKNNIAVLIIINKNIFRDKLKTLPKEELHVIELQYQKMSTGKIMAKGKNNKNVH